MLSLLLCAFLFALGGSFPLNVSAQPQAQQDFLAPPRNNLVPFHWPDLMNLEPGVREHLATVRKILSAGVKDQAASEAKLAELYGEAGRIYHAYSLNFPARECYENASRLAPKDFRWLYLLAKLDQVEGKANDAIRRYQAASALNPEYAPVAVNLGLIYLDLNSPENAETSFRKALAIESTNPAALYGLGQLALSQRRFADAVSYFNKALTQVPDANRVHYSLGLAYRGLGDLAQAELHLAKRGTVGIRVVDPLVDQLADLVESERLHLVRGRAALEAKRFQDAVAEFRAAIAAKPGSISPHLNLGAALLQMNDLTGATAEFETALRIDSTNENARFNLAIIQGKQMQHTQAVASLQTLLKINPEDVGARLFLAQELLQLGRREEALAEFARVSQTDPDNEEALLEEVRLLEQLKNYKQALDELERAHKLYPQKTRTSALLAYTLATSPRFDFRQGQRALDLAQRVYETTGLPQDGAIVALALAELGRCTEAAAWQRRMIAIADKQGQSKLTASLTTDLKLFEATQNCRPGGESQ